MMAGLALLSGCGGTDPDAALRDTSRNLTKIHSGNLTMRLVLRSAKGPGIGFQLHGPFSLGPRGRLPIARIQSTQTVGDRRTQATLLSTGRAAFVRAASRTYRLSPQQARSLRIVPVGARGSDAGQGLSIDRWIRDADTSDGSRRDGEQNDRITGKLRIGPALHDVFDAARSAGANSVPSDKQLGRLDDAVTDSSIEVLTSKHDRLLRVVRLKADLDVPQRLRGKLGSGARLHIEFEFGIADSNRHVRVHAPASSPPLP